MPKAALCAAVVLAFVGASTAPCFAQGQEGFVQVERGRVFYEVRGSGAPVVLIHGGQMDRRMWDRELDLLAKSYRAIRYDARGYGRSSDPLHPYSDAADLLALLDFLKVDRAHLVGLSLGGRISLDFAVTHPERVASMVLVGPGLSGFDFSNPDPDSGRRYERLLEAAREEGPEAAADLWLQDPYMIPAMEEPARAERIRELARDNGRNWLVNPLLERSPIPPAAARLGEIRVPTLIVKGDRDVPYIDAVVAALGKGIPGAETVIVRGAGHIVNMEKPEEFDRILLAFLARQAPPRPPGATPTTASPAAPAGPTLAERVNRPVLLTVPGMDRVVVKKDLVFTAVDDPNVKMDVYLPPATKAAAGAGTAGGSRRSHRSHRSQGNARTADSVGKGPARAGKSAEAGRAGEGGADGAGAGAAGLAGKAGKAGKDAAPAASPAQGLPVVVFVHGGVESRFRPKEWGLFDSWGRLAAASGMAAVVFTHRLSYPDARFREAEADVAAALRYLPAHAGELGIDPSRIALVYFSGGGPLLSAALRGVPPEVRALVTLYAYLDVQGVEDYRKRHPRELLRELSPIHHLAAHAGDMPPLLVVRAGRDEIPGLDDSIDRFVEEALARNAPVTVVNHPEAPHGFDNQLDTPRTREVLGQVLAFLRFHLRAGE